MAYSSGRHIGGLGVDYYEDPFARVDFGPPEQFRPPSEGLFNIGFGWADESFSVYEHPQTFIFTNECSFTMRQLSEEIGSADLKGSQLQQSDSGLLLSEGDALSQQSGGP